MVCHYDRMGESVSNITPDMLERSKELHVVLSYICNLAKQSAFYENTITQYTNELWTI